MGIKNMKIVRGIELDNNIYDLVEFKIDNNTYYGTIESKYIIGDKIKKDITLMELFKGSTEAEAIENRKQNIEAVKFMKSMGLL